MLLFFMELMVYLNSSTNRDRICSGSLEVRNLNYFVLNPEPNNAKIFRIPDHYSLCLAI